MANLNTSVVMLSAVLVLSACGSGRPAEGPELPPPAPGETLPILLQSVRMDIPRGTDLGGYEFGLLCAPPYERIGWTTARQLLSGALDTVEDGMPPAGWTWPGRAAAPSTWRRTGSGRRCRWPAGSSG